MFASFVLQALALYQDVLYHLLGQAASKLEHCFGTGRTSSQIPPCGIGSSAIPSYHSMFHVHGRSLRAAQNFSTVMSFSAMPTTRTMSTIVWGISSLCVDIMETRGLNLKSQLRT